MEFRGDIQLLRAVAVISVVLFHLGMTNHFSGFLGVDVFFVVSGFLMQAIFTQQPNSKDFFRRRGRRLLPAYYVTILSTLVACFFVTVPTDFRQAASQSLYSTFFLPNIYFWMQEGYFSKLEFNPLLHLWSLGVELQFYAFFPFIFYASVKKKWFAPTAFTMSLVACFALIIISPKTSFYAMPLRLWEFLLGIEAARSAGDDRKTSGTIAFALLLACLGLPVDGEAHSILHGHPALPALLITLATACVLKWKMHAEWLKNGIGKLLIGVGDRSYSIYLVHFPVIALYYYVPFGGIDDGAGNKKDILLVVVIVAIIAEIFYRFVENRGKSLFCFRNLIICTTGVACVSLTSPIMQMGLYPRRQQMVFNSWIDRSTYRCGTVFRIVHPTSKFCVLDPVPNPNETVIFLGDSHADSIKSTFANVARRARVNVAFSVANNPLMKSSSGNFIALSEDEVLQEARAVGARRIILHYSMNNLTPSLIETALVGNRASGIETILILPTPNAKLSVSEMMYKNLRYGQDISFKSARDYEEELAPVRTYLKSFHPGLKVIETKDAFCNEVRCEIADKKGVPYYFDSGHLTITGSSVLAGVLSSIILSENTDTSR